MRHRVKKRTFNRDTNNRKALLRNLVRELVEHGSIVTTVAKAKETGRIADKLIGKATKDSVPVRRQLHTFFGKRDVVNTLVERIAPEFDKRVSGFTRIVKIEHRRGDNTQLARLELIKKPAILGSLKKPVSDEVVEPVKKKEAASKKETVSKKETTAKETAATKKQVASRKALPTIEKKSVATAATTKRTMARTGNTKSPQK